jgi:hypothetical protein
MEKDGEIFYSKLTIRPYTFLNILIYFANNDTKLTKISIKNTNICEKICGLLLILIHL